MSAIKREKVTWMRSGGSLGQGRITHPTLWVYVANDGTERYFDTKSEAVARRDQDESEVPA